VRGGCGRGLDGSSGRRLGVNAGSVDMDFDEDRLVLDDTAKVSVLLFVFCTVMVITLCVDTITISILAFIIPWHSLNFQDWSLAM
jgi:hypothetical protein